MLSDAEREMRIRIAADVEFERLVEYVLITAGRRIEQADRFTGANLLSAHDGVAGGRARELDHRGGPAHDFLDRGFYHRRIGLEPAKLFGIFDKREQAAAGR